MARILLAEDDPALASAFAGRLELLGHSVTWSSNGAVAIAAFRTASFDLVLTDFRMPQLNGADLIALIRAAPHGSATPIILMSGGLPSGIDADALPIQGFLAKPFTDAALAAMVEVVLTRRGPAAPA